MKANQICADLKDYGTASDGMYTNEEIVNKLQELERALAGELHVATHEEHTHARNIMRGITKLATEHGLETTSEFQRLTDNMNTLGYTIGSYKKGFVGEQKAREALRLFELDKDVRILYNVALDDGDAQAEYDAVILAPYGVFVVEVKNFDETVRITEKGMIERKGHSYNLGGRMNCKEYLLRKTLGDTLPTAHYHCLLLFVNERSELIDDFGRIQICYRNTIVKDIQAFDIGRIIYNHDQILEMERVLRTAHTERKHACDVDCEAIKEDFASLMEQITAVPEDTETLCTEEINPEPTRVEQPKVAAKQFSWKTFFCGIGAAAIAAIAVVAVAVRTNSEEA